MMTNHKAGASEADVAERSTRRVKVVAVGLWATLVTGIVGTEVALQHAQSDRANRRLDKLEQGYLPAKTALRDKQYEQMSTFACAVVEATPAGSVLRAIAKANGLDCSALAPVIPKAAAPSATTSSQPGARSPAGTVPSPEQRTTTVHVPAPTTRTRTVHPPAPSTPSRIDITRTVCQVVPVCH